MVSKVALYCFRLIHLRAWYRPEVLLWERPGCFGTGLYFCFVFILFSIEHPVLDFFRNENEFVSLLDERDFF